MAADHRLHNAGSVSVVIDAAGHILDADDVMVGNPNGAVLRPLIESGQLTDLGPVGELPQSDVAEEKPAADEKPAAAPTKTKD